MRHIWLALIMTAVAPLLASAPSRAQPVEIPPTWGGDFWSRPRLTGDWGGLRDDLGKKGIVFDVDLFLGPQSVFGGGKEASTRLWGNARYTINVDTDKAGLWPGGFFRISANSSFGTSVQGATGGLVPVSLGLLVPQFGAATTGLENLTFMQFLSPKIGFVGGKVFTLDSSAGEFTGNYRTQFMNTALALPTAMALVPLSAFGGGVVFLPSESIVLSAMALDPSGTVMDNDITKAFSDGVMVVGAGKLTVNPFGLVGHQSLTGMWSNKSRISLIQDPSNLGRFLLTSQFPLLADPGPGLTRILERYFPGLLVPVQPANREGSTWAVVYGFDQYVWQPAGDAKRGIGVFFNFGASDGRANPVQYSYNLGIGAKGMVPGRPDDSFGIGWARTQFSGNFAPLLRRRLGLGLEHEDALELYYNAAITPWLNLGLDLQVIRPAVNKVLDANGNLRTLNTAVVGGLRLYSRF